MSLRRRLSLRGCGVPSTKGSRPSPYDGGWLSHPARHADEGASSGTRDGGLAAAPTAMLAATAAGFSAPPKMARRRLRKTCRSPLATAVTAVAAAVITIAPAPPPPPTRGDGRLRGRPPRNRALRLLRAAKAPGRLEQ
eukprot:gene15671-biopygen2425